MKQVSVKEYNIVYDDTCISMFLNKNCIYKIIVNDYNNKILMDILNKDINFQYYLLCYENDRNNLYSKIFNPIDDKSITNKTIQVRIFEFINLDYVNIYNIPDIINYKIYDFKCSQKKILLQIYVNYRRISYIYLFDIYGNVYISDGDKYYILYASNNETIISYYMLIKINYLVKKIRQIFHFDVPDEYRTNIYGFCIYDKKKFDEKTNVIIALNKFVSINNYIIKYMSILFNGLQIYKKLNFGIFYD